MIFVLASSELKIWEWRRAILLVIIHPRSFSFFRWWGGAGKRGEKGENLRFGNGAISFAPRPG